MCTGGVVNGDETYSSPAVKGLTQHLSLLQTNAKQNQLKDVAPVTPEVLKRKPDFSVRYHYVPFQIWTLY